MTRNKTVKTEDYRIGDLIRDCDGDLGVIVSFLEVQWDGDPQLRVYYGSISAPHCTAGFHSIHTEDTLIVSPLRRNETKQ